MVLAKSIENTPAGKLPEEVAIMLFTSARIKQKFIVPVGAGDVTATLVVAVADPPGPVQVIVYVFPAVSAPVDSVPEVAFVPDQSTEAVQVVALVDVQVSVEAVPDGTVPGLAVIVTVGTDTIIGFTFTNVDAVAVPPGPVQVIV